MLFNEVCRIVFWPSLSTVKNNKNTLNWNCINSWFQCVVSSVIERPDAVPETVVAVFPPSDICVSDNHRADERQFYPASDSTISSIKCVMSTILFLAVVTVIIVVAFVKNPGMWLSVIVVISVHHSSQAVPLLHFSAGVIAIHVTAFYNDKPEKCICILMKSSMFQWWNNNDNTNVPEIRYCCLVK